MDFKNCKSKWEDGLEFAEEKRVFDEVLRTSQARWDGGLRRDA
jgi:hypothetical protein